MGKQTRRRSKASRSGRRPRSTRRTQGRPSSRRTRSAQTTRNAASSPVSQIGQRSLDANNASAVKAGPVRTASLLIGAAAGMVVAGLAGRLQLVLAQPPASAEIVSNMVIAAALLTLALGVRLPQQIVVWVCTAAWRRLALRGRPSRISAVLIDPEEADRPLFWVVLSVIALAGGLLIALLPRGVALAEDLYTWMLAHFLWSLGPLAVLQTAMTFLIAVIPLTALGMAVSCVHHLSCLYGRWETWATAWLLIGAAVALLASQWVFRGQAQGDLALAAAAIPALLTSLVSATSRSAHSGLQKASGGVEPMPLPIWSDRWPTLLRATTVALACVGVCALTVWVRCFRAETGRGAIHVAGMLFALGLGVLVESWRTPAGCRSIGGFGVICAATGVVVGLSTLGTGEMLGVKSVLDLVIGFVSLAVVGFATAYGWQTLLSRAAQRSVAGAIILARMLAFAGLIVWVGAPLADRFVGAQTALMILAFFLAALGGALILHEPR